jgi:DNA polymerase-3 subunit gamma/tau
MSDQVLARKWRPDSFESLVGQSHVVRALTNALDLQRLHHAYLFTGTRGVGKTTLGRILAKCLNCESGITSKPCNRCFACEEIATGRFMDLIEVDAASRTKVEDTRELLENVPYAPTSGRFKVYLIDEVHMLSTHSFNALLKTLEEPPPHVKFFLATTDPQKLPITVLSRCLQFHLKCISPEQISQHLAYILQQENFGYEEDALTRLAYAAQGSMRDALSLLDQAISFSEGQVSTAAVKSMLSTIEATYIYQIVAALKDQDAHALIHITTQLAEQSVDCSNVLEELLAFLHQLALHQFVPDANMGSWDREKITQFASEISAEDLQLYYQIALIGRKDLPLAPTPRMGLEMTLLRMLAFRPGGTTPLAPALPQTVSKPTTTVSPPQKSVGSSSQWSEIVSAMKLAGMTAAIANNCVLEKITDNEVHLAIEPSQSVLLNKKHEERLAQSLQEYFNRPIVLTIRKGQTDMATPAAKEQEHKAQRKVQAQDAIVQDPNVQKIIETFDATLLPDSIEARD